MEHYLKLILINDARVRQLWATEGEKYPLANDTISMERKVTDESQTQSKAQ